MEKQRRHTQRDNRVRAVDAPIGSGRSHPWTDEGKGATKNPPWACAELPRGQVHLDRQHPG
eukprot:2128987-Pyramimonas_sp.AAC.1